MLTSVQNQFKSKEVKLRLMDERKNYGSEVAMEIERDELIQKKE